MSAGTVLQTKLQAPPGRPRLVPRPGLLAGLDAGATRKLTLVSAPAGFGKTTLIGAWLAGGDRPHSWLTLDENDNDPARFLTYLVMALQRVEPGIGRALPSVLRASRLSSFDPLLTDLLNDVAALPEPITLVLDDYHVIHTPAVHEALAFILEHQPRQLHLVIVTREDPMLPLPRLRARGELTEIHAEQLRFGEGEATVFLNEIMGLGLAAEGVGTLESRTEGWIAGLQLAALALQHEADKRSFIETFAGDDRYVADYLVSEVLQRQPPEIRTFLLSTSILERLTAPLCDALTGGRQARALLGRIERANLFLIPLDHRREVYRYHQLFGEMLRSHLSESRGADEVAELHRRAGEWYRRHELLDDAIRHLLEAAAFGDAASLVESVGLELLSRGRLRQLRAWLQALPETLVSGRPLLCVQDAWALNLMGDLPGMDARLAEAERALPSDDATLDRRLRGMIATIRAGAARKRHAAAEAIRQLRIALACLPGDDLLLRSSANFNLGSTYLDLGELDLADEALQAAREDGAASGGMYSVLAALSYQADGRVLQGRLEEAAGLYREAVALGSDLGQGQPHPLAGFAYAGLGRVLYEQNRLDDAERELHRAIALGERLGDEIMAQRGRTALARLKHVRGEREAALTHWRQAVRLARRYRDAAGEASLEALRVQLLLTRVESPRGVPAWSEVERWARRYLRRRPDPRSYQEEFAQRTLAQVELVSGEPDRALRRLTLLEGLARAGRRHDSLLKILTVRALAEAAREGAEDRAPDTLARALELGRPAGYVRSFIDHGAPMRRLLERASERGAAPGYASALLAAFGEEAGGEAETAAPPAGAAAPLEAVTDRERQILRLMAAFRTNKEIARELDLSVNTVKWHSRIIYDKLGVHKRAEAVARAKALELL